ncbi:sigma-54 interaction domain-containing protein [Anaerosalibacter bizertensis]|uniref:sigma-54 interaction domain-containing protein n=1 Tax=Anaerosalibacter bizertensis TaxID=932217 RepID=UPI0035145E2B
MEKDKLVEENIENILDSIPAGILTSDLSGTIRIINKSIIKLFGYSEEKIKSMKIWDLVKNWNMVLDEVHNNGSFTNEDVQVNAHTNRLKLNLSAYPIYDSKERIVEITCIFNEVKKPRKLANRLIKSQAIYTFDKIIGKNQNFIDIINYSKQIADSRSNVIIVGDSGTGKEVFAQSIHNYSSRKDKPFIAVNCGAIPSNLIESELFGYEEGAFTGARPGGHLGKFEAADGGTIFLDEIGEMPLDMQIKLLRVIEEGVINRIGSIKQIPVNIRIISATNKDLKDEVAKGKFRKDLFYRINVIPIYLPSLKDRKDDIPILIDYFMERISKHLNKRKVDIPIGYMERLINYDWPGNIRELENLIELIINTGSIKILDKLQFNTVEPTPIKSEEIDEIIFTLETVEKKYIEKALNKFDGNISQTAKALGIGRNTLYRKIKKYSI